MSEAELTLWGALIFGPLIFGALRENQLCLVLLAAICITVTLAASVVGIVELASWIF